MTAPEPNAAGGRREIRLIVLAVEGDDVIDLDFEVEYRNGDAPSPLEVLGLLEFAKEWKLEELRDFNRGRADEVAEIVDHGPVKPPYGTPEREAYDREHGSRPDGMAHLHDCCPAAPTEPHTPDCGLSPADGAS